MSTPSSDYTPEMIQAERTLDSRIEHALSKGRAVRAKVDEVSERLATAEPPTDAEVERFRAFISDHVRTEAWQPVIDRIARGELTWREIVVNMAAGQMDPDVAAGMSSLTQVPPATTEELVEIGVMRAYPERADEGAADAESEDGTESGKPAKQQEQDDKEWGDISRWYH